MSVMDSLVSVNVLASGMHTCSDNLEHNSEKLKIFKKDMKRECYTKMTFSEIFPKILPCYIKIFICVRPCVAS